jgi:hypothetical protein
MWEASGLSVDVGVVRCSQLSGMARSALYRRVQTRISVLSSRWEGNASPQSGGVSFTSHHREIRKPVASLRSSGPSARRTTSLLHVIAPSLRSEIGNTAAIDGPSGSLSAAPPPNPLAGASWKPPCGRIPHQVGCRRKAGRRRKGGSLDERSPGALEEHRGHVERSAATDPAEAEELAGTPVVPHWIVQ